MPGMEVELFDESCLSEQVKLDSNSAELFLKQNKCAILFSRVMITTRPPRSAPYQPRSAPYQLRCALTALFAPCRLSFVSRKPCCTIKKHCKPLHRAGGANGALVGCVSMVSSDALNRVNLCYQNYNTGIPVRTQGVR